MTDFFFISAEFKEPAVLPVEAKHAEVIASLGIGLATIVLLPIVLLDLMQLVLYIVKQFKK